MSKIAKDAFANSNYHLAVEIFERCLREKLQKNLPISLDLYFWYGDSLANCGRLHEAFDIYVYIASKLASDTIIPLDRLMHLTNSLIDNVQQQQQQHVYHSAADQMASSSSSDRQCHFYKRNSPTETITSSTTSSTSTTTIATTSTSPGSVSNVYNRKNYQQQQQQQQNKLQLMMILNNASNNNNNQLSTFDPLLCSICNDVLNCPVTATCGHTFCRDCCKNVETSHCHMCLIENTTNINKNNRNCKNSNLLISKNLKPDILVRRLVDKWWGPQLHARELNEQAIKYIHLNSFDDALKCCNESLEKCPKNVNSLLLRSEVLFRLSHYQSSLADADNAIRCHPTSAKAFYRRSLALTGLNRHDDAIVAQCLAASLDRKSSCTSTFKTDLARLLQKNITSATRIYSNSNDENLIILQQYNSMSNRRRHQQHKRRRIQQKTQNIFGTSDCDDSSCGDDDDEIDDSGDDDESIHFSRRYSRRKQSNRLETTSIPRTSTTFRILLDRIQQEVHKLKKTEKHATSSSHLNVTSALIDVADFDCVLCCRTLWKPVVTPCGHTYCWVCLDRCMDYSSSCPLCMTPLVEQYISNYHHQQQICGTSTPVPFALGEKSVTRFLEAAMQQFIPEWYEKRRRQEMETEPSVPVFICTTAFPNVPCPLFVYEPRYRLMVRRAIESGERQFGIVQPLNGKSRYSDIGTMLDIRDSVLLGDGCSILSTIGCKRFKILTRNEKDGYETAKVEYIYDEPIMANSFTQVNCMHGNVLRKARKWYEGLDNAIKEEILRSFGSMPALEDNWECVDDGPAWAWWIIAILPLHQQLKFNILATTSLEKRLRAIGRTLDFINGKVRRSQQNCIAVPCDGLPACQAVECCQRTTQTSQSSSDEHVVPTNQHSNFLL